MLADRGSLQLIGGWGYPNLGDEAILSGYLAEFEDRRPTVISRRPEQTRRAQSPGTRVIPERLLNNGSRTAPTLVCGGGYLNGSWLREIYRKLWTIDRLTSQAPVRVAHAIEVRGLTRAGQAVLFRRAFGRMKIAVRDERSAQEVIRVGLPEPTVLPDAISLIHPHIGRYEPKSESRGRVLLNLLDVTRRPDRHEAEFDVSSWRPFCLDLVQRLGSRALGLVVGAEDATFMEDLGLSNVIRPTTTAELIGLLAAADGVISTRMHPFLLGTMLNVPTVGVPYCGKVRPTAQLVGVGHSVMDGLDVASSLRALSDVQDAEGAWRSAWQANHQWLRQALEPTA